MGWFLFGARKQLKPNFRAVDWSAVEAAWRKLETMILQKEQATLKQALIQADMLIDSILKQAGVRGETMGERLKNLHKLISAAELNQLWQAHKKRNELVHEPTSFVAEWEKETFARYFKEAIEALRRMTI